jgi:hypothetical protein
MPPRGLKDKKVKLFIGEKEPFIPVLIKKLH